MTALAMPLKSSASESPAVSVTVLGSKKVNTQVFTTKVKVCFNDMSLYNEGMYLSYHIYDTSDFHQSTLDGVFENERFYIVLDENNCAEFEISIDCSQLGYDDAYIQFDIVDTINLFWFYLLNDSSRYSLDMIHSADDQLMKTVENYIDTIQENLVVFICNVVALIGVIAAIVYVRRKKLFTFKRNSK